MFQIELVVIPSMLFFERCCLSNRLLVKQAYSLAEDDRVVNYYAIAILR